MKYDPRFHHRRSIRLKGYDYTGAGAYFVTLVTHPRERLFGEISDGEIRLNQFGQIAYMEWMKTAEIRLNVELYEDEFVMMPNHVHGLIWIVEHDPGVGATGPVAPTGHGGPGMAPNQNRSLIPSSLGAIIGQYKTAVAKRINALRGTPGVHVWQRNYHEHILRNDRELKAIRNYIDANPANWENDEENP